MVSIIVVQAITHLSDLLVDFDDPENDADYVGPELETVIDTEETNMRANSKISCTTVNTGS